METLNVVNTCYGNELMKSMLPHLLEQLELCQKSLSAYLETKRAEFPRWAGAWVADPDGRVLLFHIRDGREGPVCKLAIASFSLQYSPPGVPGQ